MVQVALSAYLALMKFRQARATYLFFLSFYNFLGILVIALSLTNAIFVLIQAGRIISRAFVAYTTAIIWVDLILAARIYEQAGVMMILLTEMIKSVASFLAMSIIIKCR